MRWAPHVRGGAEDEELSPGALKLLCGATWQTLTRAEDAIRGPVQVIAAKSDMVGAQSEELKMATDGGNARLEPPTAAPPIDAERVARQTTR